jgi:hypothetical protein
MQRITELCKQLGAPLLQVEDGNIWEFADRSKLMFQRDKVSILED